jgi:hypothetical protein
MRTTLQLLPAVNNLYSLNLTPIQLSDLQTGAKTYQALNDLDLNGSIWHFSLSDTILAYRSITDSYEVQLRKVPTDPSNKTVSVIEAMKQYKLSNCYVYTITNRYDMPNPTKGFILPTLKDINIDELKMLDLFLNLLTERKCAPEGLQSITTLNAGIKLCKKHMLANLEKFNRTDSPGIDAEHMKPLGILLQKLWPTLSQSMLKNDAITTKQTEILNRVEDMGLIVYTGEAANHRCVIVKHGSGGKSYYYNRRSYEDFSLFIIPHTHPAYDYCDIRRFIYMDMSSYETCIGKYFFLDDEPAIPEQVDIINECGRAKGITKDHLGLLTNAELTQAVKRFINRENRVKRESDAQERLQKKAGDKIKVLQQKDGELKINDMIFTQSAIEYQGQELKLSPDHDSTLLTNWPYTLVRHLTRYQNISDIHFDTVIQAFVKLITGVIIDQKTEVSGKIGDVTFAVTHQESTNTRGITSIRWYVNERRINAQELEQVLERALCFENQVDYNSFVKSVSSCSLFFHRYLQIGIDIAVADQFDNTQVTMKFPLERRRGKMYLVLGEREFPVSDTHKLIRLSKKQNILEVITTLLDGSTVYNVQADDIKQLILDGKQAYVEAIEKSKILLQETEDLFSITAETMQVGGKSKFGYKIEGDIRTYFLEKPDMDAEEQSRSCGVYDFYSGQYICIVDKSTSQVGQDKLVNRIFALHNDSRVAKHITTLTSKN